MNNFISETITFVEDVPDVRGYRGGSGKDQRGFRSGGRRGGRGYHQNNTISKNRFVTLYFNGVHIKFL